MPLPANWRSAATTRLLSVDRSLAAPAPSGMTLTATIPCRTSADPGVPPSHHAIEVGSSWGTTVPHDLEAERVAAAFGGRCSCLTLDDVVMPALRWWVAINLRLAPVDVRPALVSDGWLIGTPASCCRDRAFGFAAEAATHARGHAHVAQAHGTPRDVLAALASASQQAHGPAMRAAHHADHVPRAASACRAGLRDVSYLWDAGLSPATIVRIHGRLGLRRPLQRRFYLGVATLRPDLTWLRECIARGERHHDSIESWLAWTASSWDRDDRAARPRWLDLGVSREAMLALGEAGIDPGELADYAAQSGQTPDAVALSLCAAA